MLTLNGSTRHARAEPLHGWSTWLSGTPFTYCEGLLLPSIEFACIEGNFWESIQASFDGPFARMLSF
jgi:hypothetical protein